MASWFVIVASGLCVSGPCATAVSAVGDGPTRPRRPWHTDQLRPTGLRLIHDPVAPVRSSCATAVPAVRAFPADHVSVSVVSPEGAAVNSQGWRLCATPGRVTGRPCLTMLSGTVAPSGLRTSEDLVPGVSPLAIHGRPFGADTGRPILPQQ